MESVRDDQRARRQSLTPVTCDCHPHGGGVVMAKRRPDGSLVVLKRSHGGTHILAVDKPTGGGQT